MTAENLALQVHELLRLLTPTLTMFRAQTGHRQVFLAFDGVDDFVATVAAAHSANIAAAVVSTFVGKNAAAKPIGSCVLELEIPGSFQDERIADFIGELLTIRCCDGSSDPESLRRVTSMVSDLAGGWRSVSSGAAGESAENPE